MDRIRSAFTRLSDSELLAEVKRLADCEHQATANLVACLCELDSRRLYRDAGYSSLFIYATQALGLSEASAYFRIEAARAANRWPMILERLAAGAITLSAIKLLAPHLTDENHRGLLDAARGKTKRAVEELVARLAPRPDLPSTVRKLPVPRATATAPGALPAPVAIAADQASKRANPGFQDPEKPVETLFTADTSAGLSPAATPSRRPAVIAPLAPERYKVQMTVGAKTHAKLRRAQELMRHSNPDGDPAVIFDRALTVLIEQLERTKCGSTKRRRPQQGVALTPGGAACSGMPAEAPRTSSACDANLRTERESSLDVRRTGSGTSPHSRAPVATSSKSEPVAGRVEPPPRNRHSRHIPAAVKREVWGRDSGRCTFVAPDGRRCGQRGFLEYHHAQPFAAGGEATVDNVRILCNQHNRLEAERFFGGP